MNRTYRIALIAAFFLAIVVALALASHSQEQDGAGGAPHFKHIKPSEFVGNTFTHVETNGIVRYVRGENDGDVHVMVCETPSSSGTVHHYMQGCVLVECIPAIPLACKEIKHGDVITVWGISRYDRYHHWNELHPALGFSKVK